MTISKLHIFRYTPGEFPLPTETQSADFYRIASETLTNAGYNHYEISSYCKSGYECSHNLAYWLNKPFYGFGLGSTSYVDGVRFSRPKRLKDYTNYVLKLENGEVENSNDLIVEAKDMAMDVVMLSLRTARGLDMCKFERSYGKELVSALYEAFRPYIESGHVIVMNEDRKRLGIEEVGFLRLSDPDGFLLSNELISIAFGVISP